jgi:hypothetical protein
MEIVVAGKSSRVSDALPELNPAQLEQLEPIVMRAVASLVSPARRMRTIREFAKANGIGMTLAYEELNAGRLEACKIGTKTMVTPEAEDAWRANLRRYKPTKELEST